MSSTSIAAISILSLISLKILFGTSGSLWLGIIAFTYSSANMFGNIDPVVWCEAEPRLETSYLAFSLVCFEYNFSYFVG